MTIYSKKKTIWRGYTHIEKKKLKVKKKKKKLELHIAAIFYSEKSPFKKKNDLCENCKYELFKHASI